MSHYQSFAVGFIWCSLVGILACRGTRSVTNSTTFLQKDSIQLAPPVFSPTASFFEKSTKLIVNLDIEGVELAYELDTKDKTQKGVYTQPLELTDDFSIQAKAQHSDFKSSVSSRHTGIRTDNSFPYKIVSLSPMPNEQYTGNGISNLQDKIKGGDYYKTKEWLGFKEKEVEIVVALEQPITHFSCIISCLISQNSWIFAPEAISVEGSVDGKNFGPVNPWTPLEPTPQGIEFYFPKIRGTLKDCRFLRIKIKPLSQIPEWHSGVGQPAWLFVDEILIKEW